MMIKLRALNESSDSSGESEDDDHPRLSNEAQEAQAKSLYSKAQLLTINKDDERAMETFVQILCLPYLNKLENKPLSPVQLQLRLGCLKCLSTLYRSGSTKNLPEAIRVLDMITKLEPNNVTFWYRLGNVALEHHDFELAFDAFKCTLDCSPGHWGSIENLVTISYVLHDLLGCLRYCSMGLSKDSGFLKGYVFRDHIFKCNPWIRTAFDTNMTGFESLFVKDCKPYSEQFRTKCLGEAQSLMHRFCEQKTTLRQKEENEVSQPVKCPFRLKSFSFADLGQVVVDFYHYLKDSGTIMRPVDFNSLLSEVSSNDVLENVDLENLENSRMDTGEQSCSSSVLRTRSSSDDKEVAQEGDDPDPSKLATDNSQVSDTDDKNGEDDSQPVIGIADEETSQRKKGAKNVKWWQMEGQRRSQRVRGNLISAPSKPKPESTFAETLKNIIPPVLLTEESKCSREREQSKPFSRLLNISSKAYFGTLQEAEDVKNFLHQWGETNILTITSELVRLLSRNCKGHWSSNLRAVFLDLYTLYRNAIPVLFTNDREDAQLKDIENDAFTVLTKAELSLDSDNTTSSTSPECLLLLENVSPTLIGNEDFYLRLQWLRAKDSLQQCKNDLMDYTYANWHLKYVLDILKSKPENHMCFVPTKNDHIISVRCVEEKINFVKKIENLNRIEELYAERRYHDLIDILEFSLSSSESNDDIHNRMCLAESYLKMERIQCVEQCDIVVEIGLRSASEEILLGSVDLLEAIWDGMQRAMTLKEFKLIINMLIKILIFNEKQLNLSSDVLLTKPWCLLHSVLFYLEEKESSFFIQEDNLPNSISTLQLGHEILSKAGKCCSNNGQLLSHTMLGLLRLQNVDEYWGFEETKNCLDQAILCLYSHPNKKFKLKNLKDHGSVGIDLDWRACCKLYHYYKLEELPEFDSRANKSINAELETLFLRMIQEIPDDFDQEGPYVKMKDYVEGKSQVRPRLIELMVLPILDVFYFLADFYFKTQELNKAVEYYTRDLLVCSRRFDSWTAIALAKAEDIFSTINSCESFSIADIIPKAEAVIRCFKEALNLDVANTKVRIEFGSFLYSLHSVYSRELKFHADKFGMELWEEIEMKKKGYLLEAQHWFKPFLEPEWQWCPDEGVHEEVWINHYMLGKVAEKLHPNEPEKFLTQYELAGKLLHEKGAPYPSRINYYSPPDDALEALEIYYRIHASILSYVESSEYTTQKEEVLLSFLRRAEESEFVTCKQGRGAEGDSKRKKATDESVPKKDLAEINKLVKEMVDKVEQMVCDEENQSSSSGPSSVGTTESSEDESENPTSNELPAMKSLSLSAFRERMQAEEAAKLLQAEKLQESKKACPEKTPELKKTDNIYTARVAGGESIPPEKTPFDLDFSHLPYHQVIAKCLKAMRECVLRYPQCFKAYFRLANTYVLCKKDHKKGKEYLLGNNSNGPNKIVGLYGERKPSNFFHGIWRHPVDDIDRPGSFPFHMAKSMQLLINILCKLYDHQVLAEIGIQLARVPDSKNAYLFTEDREQFSKMAIINCVEAAKKSIPKDKSRLLECGNLIYDTYTKFQKHNPRENVVAPVLLDVYKYYIQNQSMVPGDFQHIQLSEAVKYFQHVVWKTKTMGSPQKSLSYGQLTDAFMKSAFENTVPGQFPNLKQNMIRKAIAQRRMSDQEREGLASKLSNVNFLGTNSPPQLRNIPAALLQPMTSDILKNVILPNDPAAMAKYAAQFASLLANPTSVHHDIKKPIANKQIKKFDNAQTKQTSDIRQSKPSASSASRQAPPSFNSRVISTMFDNNQQKIQNKLPKNNAPNIPNLTKGRQFSVDNEIAKMTARTAAENQQLIANVCNAMSSLKSKSNSNLMAEMTSQMPTATSEMGKSEKSLPNSYEWQTKKKLASQAVASASRNTFQESEKQRRDKIKIGQTEISTVIQGNDTIPTANFIQKQMESNSSLDMYRIQNPNKSVKQRPPVARKSTGFVRGTDSPHHIVGGRPYMSSSPFQAQLTAMAKPSISGPYSTNSTRLSQSPQSGSPRPAHSQIMFQSRLSVPDEQPEVVDLTTKSPDKTQASKELQISPEKILGLETGWKNNVASGSTVEQINRPVKRPNADVGKCKQYPLPPKKKHHAIPPGPRLPMVDPSVEVITLE